MASSVASWRRMMSGVHRVVGRVDPLARAAIAVRNQCAAAIACRLSDGPDARANGEELLVRVAARTGDVFVDVGANAGDWSDLWLEVAPLNLRGVLYEPAPRQFEPLRARFASRATLVVEPVGLSDSVGTLTLHLEGGAGLTSSFATRPEDHVGSVVVPVTTLDISLSAKGIGHVDFVKVDAEGYDLHVIRGADRFLSGQQIGILQFEYNSSWAAAGSTLAAAFSFLTARGYSLHLLKSDGLWTFDYGRYGEFGAYANFVAVSPDSQSRVAHLRKGSV